MRKIYEDLAKEDFISNFKEHNWSALIDQLSVYCACFRAGFYYGSKIQVLSPEISTLLVQSRRKATILKWTQCLFPLFGGWKIWETLYEDLIRINYLAQKAR